MKKGSWIAAALLLVFVFFCGDPVFASEAKTYTNETIEALFKDAGFRGSHGVMSRQRLRLQAIQDGFLMGDKELMMRNAEELAGAMQSVARLYAPSGDAASTAWVAMAGIVGEAEEMKKKLSEDKYQEAYMHYSQLVARCVQCHQASRNWGRFEEADVPDQTGGPEKTGTRRDQ